MNEYDPFRNEQEILDHAEVLLKEEGSNQGFRIEFEKLVGAYKKLFKISRRLVRMSDRNEEHLKEANIRIKAQQEKLESEIRYAQTIQMSMVPGGGRANIEHQHYQLYAYLKPARTVGGDLYSFLQDEKLLHFLIGDVSDKGVPAALFMAKTITLYNSALNQGLSPGDIFTQMNDALCMNNDVCMFVTALCGYLDLENGKLVMSNAGHMNPVLHGNNQYGDLPVDGETALGLMEGIEYPTVEHVIDSGTRLLMYTDGITEAKNPSGEQYEEDRLLEFSRQTRADSAASLGEALLNDVDHFVNGAEQSDDITLMAIQFID